MATRPQNRDLVLSALQKRGAGQHLTQQESRALARYEKEKEEALRWDFYESIPQRHWLKMSGRQARTINAQADHHGLPFSGKTIDLPAVVHALHDFLAANAAALSKRRSADGLAETDPLQLLRGENWLIRRLIRREMEGDLLRRREVHDMHTRLAALLREAGENLKRQFGAEAHGILAECLGSMEREVDLFFDGVANNGESATTD